MTEKWKENSLSNHDVVFINEEGVEVTFIAVYPDDHDVEL
ncbi:hypothetical protein VCHA53P481_400007 [Vibrio chagasii]|nr:hypothetical protein VCHA53P481_400007 [Vibrio chagasii]